MSPVKQTLSPLYSAKYQYFATITVNLLNLMYGLAAGWPSSSLLILESDDTSPLEQGALDKEERSWVTSLFAISGVFGTIFFYWISDIYGRKYTLMSMAIPHGISWILIEFAKHPWHLYLSRVLSGVASGGAFAIVPLFVSEISETSVRGRLGSMLMLSANSGFLLAFIAGHYCSYQTIPITWVGIPIIFLCIFQMFPETPIYLLKHNKAERAEASLKFYRNVQGDDQYKEYFQKEWEQLKSGLKPLSDSDSSSDNNSITLKDLYGTRAGRKAFLIGIMLIALHEFCGCFTMLNYTAIIFRESGSDISPNFSAIIVGFIQLLGTYAATFLVDLLGRKFLLTFSSVGTGLSLLCLGSYTYAHNLGFNVAPYSWISIASFSAMMFLAACGIIPLMFVVISEVMPEKIRSIGCTICFCLSWVLAFLMVKFFESIAETVGMHGWVFFFSICTFIGAIFIVLVIPETKGKTYAEIAAILER